MNGKGQLGVIAAVGAVAFSGGVALGHFLTKKKAEKFVDDALNTAWRQQLGAINEVKETKDGIEVTGTLTPEGAALVDGDPEFKTIKTGRLVSFGPTSDPGAPGYVVSVTPVEGAPETDEANAEPTSKNIFDDNIPGWDYEEELTARESKQIYIITHDEFFGDEMGYKQDQLTYYKGDDMMCDALNKPIYNYSNFVGDNLSFGHGSKDPNVVFVRNEKERIEWEIALDVGRYEEEVLGLSVEEDYREQDESIQHSVRRFVME